MARQTAGSLYERSSLRAARLATLVALLALSASGCQSKKKPPGAECRTTADCQKNLICSNAGRCIQKVDCKRLEARLERCAIQMVEQLVSAVRRLPDHERRRLEKAVGRRLSKEASEACPFSVTSTPPGEELSSHPGWAANSWRRCLSLSGCEAFARCVLRLARLSNQKRETGGEAGGPDPDKG